MARRWMWLVGRVALASAWLVAGAGANPFGEDDEAVGGLVGAWFDHLGGRAEVVGTWYADDEAAGVERDRDRLVLEGSLPLHSWVSWDAMRLDAAGRLAYGSRGDDVWAETAREFTDADVRRRPLLLERLILSRTFGSEGRWEAAVGKDMLPTSVAVVGTIADRHTVAYDGNDPLDPRRFGVWQARIQYVGDAGQWTLAALPVFQPIKLPAAATRWSLDPSGLRYAEEAPDAAIRIRREDWEDRFPEFGWWARYVGYGTHWDWFATAYRGPSDHARYRVRSVGPEELVVEEHFVPCWEWSAGASGARGAWEWHGEGVYHRPDRRRGDEFLSYVLGTTVRCDEVAEWIGADDVSWSFEYLGEAERRSQVADEFVSGSLLRLRSAFLGRLAVRIDPDTSVTVRSLHDVSAEDWHQVRLEVARRLARNLHLHVSGDVMGGEDRRFEAWNRNERVRVALSYAF